MSFSGDFEVSYVTFGGYDASEFAVEEITWHKNTGEYFWAVQLDEVKFGDSTILQNDSFSRVEH